MRETINDDTILFEEIALLSQRIIAPQPIEKNTITRLKAREFSINPNDKFSSIQPNAFPRTYEHTEKIIISGHTFANTSTTFEFLNKFSNAAELCVIGEVPVPEITENAFVSLSYETGYINDNVVALIGDSAFAGLRNLSYVALVGNNISDEGISKNAFKDLAPTLTRLFFVRNKFNKESIVVNWILIRVHE